MTFTLLCSSAELVAPSVLQDSVKSIFSSFNWSGSANLQSSHSAALQSVNSNEPLHLRLSVQQFFAGIAWEAGAIAPLVLPELPQDRKALTLEDFSDLF